MEQGQSNEELQKQVHAIAERQAALEDDAAILLESAKISDQTVAKLQELFDADKLRIALARWKTLALTLLIPVVAFFLYVIFG